MSEEKYNLDTVATLFPAITTKDNSSTYRISAILKEQIDEAILQRALDDVFARFPMFNLKLVKDNFNEYLIKNPNKPTVKKDTDYPCGVIDYSANNDFMFQVIYYNNIIAIEVFHVLSDGTGALEFFKTLLYQYLLLKGKEVFLDENIIDPKSTSPPEESEDSCKKYYHTDSKTSVPKVKDAFRIKGHLYKPYGNNVTYGVLDTEELKELASNYNATITQYIAGLLIQAIYKSNVKPNIDNAPIVLAIPVNLRPFFPSKSLKNFFCVVNIYVELKDCTDLQSIIEVVKAEFARCSKKEYLKDMLDSNHGITDNIIVKKVPRLLRYAGTRFVYAFLIENLKTVTLSNVGEIKVAKSMVPHIERFEVTIYPTAKSPINCCVCSYNNRFTVNFVRSVRENKILKYFFTYLANNTKKPLNIYTNDWGVNTDDTL